VSRHVKPTLRLRDNRKFIELGPGSSDRRAESLFEGGISWPIDRKRRGTG
jgi:hypothetical protein